MPKNKKNIVSSGAKKPKKPLTDCYALICVGIPCSGKSSFSNQLTNNGWIRINQDDLGTANECKKEIKKALRHRRSIILDRCNSKMKERRMFMNEIKQHDDVKIEAVFFNTDIEECKRRVLERKNHPTLPACEESLEVIDDFARGLQIPEPWEKFDQIHTYDHVNDSERDFINIFKSYNIATK